MVVTEPQITQITLIFNRLQIWQIKQEIFDAPFDMLSNLSSGSKAHKLAQIGWRTKRNLLEKFTPNLLSPALAEYVF